MHNSRTDRSMSCCCVLCFSDLYRRIPRMKVNKLRVLESVVEISDYLWIDTNFTRLRNLNFLSNLRAIYGRHTMYVLKTYIPVLFFIIWFILVIYFLGRFSFFADRTVRSRPMIGSWHDGVVCLSACLSVCLSVILCIVALKVCVGGWKLYRRVPSRALPIYFVNPFCYTMNHVATKHSDRLKIWQASKADFQHNIRHQFKTVNE